MKLLSLDPCTNRIGYAVLEGLEPRELLDGGLIRPSVAHNVWLIHDGVPDVQAQWKCKELAAYRRTWSMLLDIQHLVNEHKPDRIVIEVPSGKFGAGAKQGARGSLTTYGAAAGIVLAHCVACTSLRYVAAVTERQWTVGAGKKEKRPTTVLGIYGNRYDPAKDKHCDLADAILLGRWWLQQWLQQRS